MQNIIIFAVGILVSMLCFGGLIYTVTEEMRKAKEGDS